MPVDNFVLEGLPELVVGKVTFRSFSHFEASFREKISEYVNITSNSDEEKAGIIQSINTNIVPLFSMAPTCAEVVVESEASRSPELIDSEVDASLNLLRMYTHLLFARDTRPLVGLRGSVVSAPRPCFLFTDVLKDDQEFSFNIKKVGLLVPYSLNNDRLEHLKTHCAFDILSAALAKPTHSQSQLEKIVITSIRWLGRGAVADDPPEKILTMSVALERLLTTDAEKHTDIGDRLAKRLAFLLSDDLEQRLKISERMKDLYGLRSEVVHAGKTAISMRDIIDLEMLACNAIIAMAGHLNDWRQHQEFVQWTEHRLFK
ncbi:MAG TPA: hypothetical protein VJ464_14830 [Blastocatellia bacterium]|nr:hypothetical protein [Blastocatellia bacterium]